MKERRPPAGGSERRPRNLTDMLVESEQLLKRHEGVDPEDRSPEATDLRECVNRAVEALERAVSEDPSTARRYARRVQRVRTLHALRARRVPAGTLDGLYEAVQARTAVGRPSKDAWDRSEMSRAFLDAPRALTLWRRTAVAACALMALGAGFFFTRTPVAVDDAARSAGAPLERFDPRDELLHRLGSVSGEVTSPGIQPASMRRSDNRRQRRFYPLRQRGGWDVRSLLDAIRIQQPRGAAQPAALEQN